MGHVTRDIAIAREIRTAHPDIAISWMAHSLAARVIKEAGEQLLPESVRSADYNVAAASSVAGNFKLSIFKYVLAIEKAYAHNVELLSQVIATRPFDLVIGDESYEVINAWSEVREQSPPHFVMIQDFIGLVPTTWNPVEKIFIWKRNKDHWLGSYLKIPAQELTHFFVGEPEDVPDQRFGFLLDNRRTWAKKMCRFLGYIVRFDPAEYQDQAKVRAKLGYGPEPLVICATGGTFVGQELLELAGRTYPLLKQKIPNLRMVFVRGESYGIKAPHLPEGADLRTYIPKIYEHFAAADLVLVVGGGTSTLELTALRRPFLYFPLERQFDQQFLISDRLARHQAGIRMEYRKTTPKSLADVILANIGKKAAWPPIPIDGARKAAEIVGELLSRKKNRG